MSFYLDDYPDDDERITSNQIICPNCSGTDFYSDPVSGALTCSSCFIQSQTATQEEFDHEEKVGLMAKTGAKYRRMNPNAVVTSGSRRSAGPVGRPLMEYDKSNTLPDTKSCCLAFQWLLWDASKCVSKLAGIHEKDSIQGVFGYDDIDYGRSIMEKTVENIWFNYLRIWMKSTAEFSAVYPEMRVSFRDYFLGTTWTTCIMRHLSVTVGKKIEEDIILKEMQKESEDRSEQRNMNDFESVFSAEVVPSSSQDRTENNDQNDEGYDHDLSSAPTKTRKRKDIRFLTVNALAIKLKPSLPDRHPNGIFNIHPHHAVLKAPPSLALILGIIQLALTHLRTGVAPYHLTMWAANGQIPHVLNGYSLLPAILKKRVGIAKSFFSRSFVPPADAVERLSCMLMAATSWFDAIPTNDPPVKGYTSLCMVRPRSDQPHFHISLYNVPVLTARIIQDLGFDQRVLDISLALMDVSNPLDGVTAKYRNKGDEYNQLPSPLHRAHYQKLYSPLHVAAVVIVACKLSPGWETWQFSNLHGQTDNGNSNVVQQPPPASVPWNESQFQLLGNGRTLNHYLTFLETNAFSSLEPHDETTQYFQKLEREVTNQIAANASNPHTAQRKFRVFPNDVLSGASNPNEPINTPSQEAAKSSLHAAYKAANNIGRYTSYRFERTLVYEKVKNRKVLRKTKTRGLKPYHPHYCRLVEYVCYIIEESDPEKVHSMVEDLEDELLMAVKTEQYK